MNYFIEEIDISFNLLEEMKQTLKAKPINVNLLLEQMNDLCEKHIFLDEYNFTLRESDNDEEFAELMNKIFQTLVSVLLETDPCFIAGDSQQCLRRMALKHIDSMVVQELPVVTKVLVKDLFDIIIRIFETDNEENCMLSFEIFFKIFEYVDITESTSLRCLVLTKVRELYFKILPFYDTVNIRMCLKTFDQSDLYDIEELLENLHSPAIASCPDHGEMKLLPRASKSLLVFSEATQVFNHIFEIWSIHYNKGLILAAFNYSESTFMRIINEKCDESEKRSPPFCVLKYFIYLKLQIQLLETFVVLRLPLEKMNLRQRKSSLLKCTEDLMKECPTSAFSLQRKIKGIFQEIARQKS